MACPASEALEHSCIDDSLPRSVLTARGRGKAVHRYLENWALGRDPWEGVEKKWKRSIAKVDLEVLGELIPRPCSPEESYALCWKTGKARWLGSSLERSYELTPTEIAGTADVVCTLDNFVRVYDYKTGSYMPRAQDNAQLYTLAVMVAKVHEVREVEVGIVDVFSAKLDTVVLTGGVLDGWEEQLKDMHVQVRKEREALEGGSDPFLWPGSYCFFCPAKLGCPASQ